MDAETIVFGVMPAVNYVVLGALGMYLHFAPRKIGKKKLEFSVKDNIREKILEGYKSNNS